MNWFDKILPPKIKTVSRIGRKGVPEGLWNKCTACQAVLYGMELTHSLLVCPKCNNHMRLGAAERLESFFDEDSIQWIAENIRPVDILKFRDQKKYKDRLQEARKNSQSSEALIAATGQISGVNVSAAAFEFKFMGGSMGSVVGERFVRIADYSLDNHQPLISFAASGGARMQEALFSLMQMAKTTAVISKLRDRGIPYISVLTDPTMGGVSASLAMLGDIIIAEPKFLLEHGAIDMIVDRRNMKQEIVSLLGKLGFGAVPENDEASSIHEIDSEMVSEIEDNPDTEESS
jgi:acetyl-CoA carboxylase carboxyl transferase subunit beta